MSGAQAHRRPIADALNGAGVRWCALWSEDAQAPVREVDLLVSPETAKAAERALKAIGYERRRGVGYPTHTYYVSASLGEIDVVTEFSVGLDHSIPVARAYDLLSRREATYGGWQVVGREDAFWVLLLHALLDKRELPTRHLETLRKLAGGTSNNGPLASLVSRVAPRGWDSGRIAQAAANERWSELIAIRARLRFRLALRGGMSTLRQALRNRVHRRTRCLRTVVR